MTSQPQPRRTRAVRIVLGVCAVALVACAGRAGWTRRAGGREAQAAAPRTAALRPPGPRRATRRRAPQRHRHERWRRQTVVSPPHAACGPATAGWAPVWMHA